MKVAAGQLGLKVPVDTSVTAEVGIGPRSEGGFGITADLTISLPGVDKAETEKIVEPAHGICLYSNATPGNVDVGLTVA